MLLVKTHLGQSPVHGIGLFADEDIQKGTAVGNNDDELTIKKYSKEEWGKLAGLSKEAFRQIEAYAYKNKEDGLYWLNLDDTRFLNHSVNPNIATVGTRDIAICNIKKGEELLIDYTTFHDGQDL